MQTCFWNLKKENHLRHLFVPQNPTFQSFLPDLAHKKLYSVRGVEFKGSFGCHLGFCVPISPKACRISVLFQIRTKPQWNIGFYVVFFSSNFENTFAYFTTWRLHFGWRRWSWTCIRPLPARRETLSLNARSVHCEKRRKKWNIDLFFFKKSKCGTSIFFSFSMSVMAWKNKKQSRHRKRQQLSSLQTREHHSRNQRDNEAHIRVKTSAILLEWSWKTKLDHIKKSTCCVPSKLY